MTYTVADTPKIIQRVDSDLRHVLANVRKHDPHLRSLVLTGGFARGEGGMLNDVPQNDYDFVAVRGMRRPNRSYAQIRRGLEQDLGIHVDLAPISSWRLRRARPTIFWYETALRGRVLWGENVLPQIPTRSAHQVDGAEGLRLLVNRAAGLLLITESLQPHEHRIQAAKGLLAAMDAHLLARGLFPPSQTERWNAMEALRAERRMPTELEPIADWLAWAYSFKVAPGGAGRRDANEAWRAAARAILDAVPAALQHAGLTSLEQYARQDGLLDHLVYWARATSVPQARRLITNPTSRVRVATLRLLEASVDGKVRPEAVRASLGSVARATNEPLRLLDGLRKATLQ